MIDFRMKMIAAGCEDGDATHPARALRNLVPPEGRKPVANGHRGVAFSDGVATFSVGSRGA
jgi:hypothetical protein